MMVGKIEEIVDRTVEKAESVKARTADTLSDASQKVRETDLDARGAEIKHFVSEADARTAHLREDLVQRVEPVEAFVKEHPFTSVLIAAGAAAGIGFLLGTLLSRRD